MRDDQRRQRLADANPWWRAVADGQDPVAWTGHHPVLKGRAAHDLGFRAGVLNDIQSGPVTDQLAVLTGPRRIGKSVALLDAAAALCARRDVDARQVIYLPCDGLAAQGVHRCLVLGRELTRSVDRDQPRPRVWLLDEISGVAGWTSVLKLARDNTAFGGDTVIATGSRWAADEGIEGNLLAGRAGPGPGRRTRLLLPMTFREYLAASRPELARPTPVHVSALQDRSAADALDAVGFDLDGYDLAWQDYLSCGGFPRAVAEHTRTGAVSVAYLNDLRSWLRADVDPDRPQDSVPRLLDGIAQRATSPLNITAATTALGYPSRDIFARRLNRLVSSCAAIWCPRREGEQAVPRRPRRRPLGNRGHHRLRADTHWPRGRPRPGHGPVGQRPGHHRPPGVQVGRTRLERRGPDHRREVRTGNPRHQVRPGHHGKRLGGTSPPAGPPAPVKTLMRRRMASACIADLAHSSGAHRAAQLPVSAGQMVQDAQRRRQAR